MKTRNLPMTLMVVLAAGAVAQAGGDGWSSLRGPSYDGQANAPGVIKKKQNPGFEVAWKVPLGSAYSGVAVADGMVVTMFAAGEKDMAGAFDTKTGKELWRYEIGPTYKGHDGSHDGPVGTPLIAGGMVFGLGPFGQLFALDGKTGEARWSHHLVDDLKSTLPFYGFGSSPIMVNGTLILLIGGTDQAIAGFDPKTGEKRWSIGTDNVTYQSLVTWDLDGKTIVVGAGEKLLLGVDPADGSRVFSYEHGGSGARGAESLVPVGVGGSRLFLAHQNDQSTVVSVDKGESGYAVKAIWEDRSIRNSFNIPVYRDGHLYTFSSRFLTCVSAKTGQTVWRSRQPGDGFLILVDDHLVVATKSGALSMGEVSTEGFTEKSRTQVFDKVAWSLPAYVDGSIYIRGFDGLARADIVEMRSEEKPLVTAVTKVKDLVRGKPVMQGLIERLVDADDKNAVVDKFMAAQARFPIIEGKNKVHFIYRGDAKDVALAGDMFGARQERPMTKVPGTNLFYYTLEVEPDAMLAYLYITDFKEMIPDALNKRATKTFMLTQDMEMSFGGTPLDMSWFAMPEWKQPSYLGQDGESGVKMDTHELNSALMNVSIPVQVLLPPGYESGETRYPVAYILDGASARSLGSWDRAVAEMNGKKVKPFIAVFLDTRTPFGPSKFGEMVSKELLPLIEGNYRTLADRNHRILIGVGFSGAGAMSTALGNADAFGKVATQSAFLFDSMVNAMKPMLPKVKAEHGMVFYMDWGKYDFRNPQEAWDIGKVNKDLAAELEAMGFTTHTMEFNQGTDWTSWRTRAPKLLETLFPTGG